MTRTSVPTLVLLDEEARRIYDAESKTRGLSLSAFLRAHARELRSDGEGAAVVLALGVLVFVVAAVVAAIVLGPLQVGTEADRTLALTVKDRTTGALADDVAVWIYWHGAPGIIREGRAVAGHAIFFGLPRDVVSLTWGCGQWLCEDAGRIVDLAPGNVNMEMTVRPCVGTCAPSESVSALGLESNRGPASHRPAFALPSAVGLAGLLVVGGRRDAVRSGSTRASIGKRAGGAITRLRSDPEGNIGLAVGALFLVAIVAFGILVLPALTQPKVEPAPGPWAFDIVPSVDTTGGDTIPAGSYDSCDVEAGGTTGEWTTTEGTYDPSAGRFRARIAIDTDLATTAALWMEPNCLQLSFLVRVVDADNPDAEVTVVGYYLRIVSISRTVLAEDNASVSLGGAGFAWDGPEETGDWLLLYRTDASVWVAACPEYRSASNLGNSCGWVRVGDHAGGAADTVLAYVVLEDRGLWGYNSPAVGDTVTIVYEFGDPDGRLVPQTIALDMVLNARGTTNLS